MFIKLSSRRRLPLLGEDCVMKLGGGEVEHVIPTDPTEKVGRLCQENCLADIISDSSPFFQCLSRNLPSEARAS